MKKLHKIILIVVVSLLSLVLIGGTVLYFAVFKPEKKYYCIDLIDVTISKSEYNSIKEEFSANTEMIFAVTNDTNKPMMIDTRLVEIELGVNSSVLSSIPDSINLPGFNFSNNSQKILLSECINGVHPNNVLEDGYTVNVPAKTTLALVVELEIFAPITNENMSEEALLIIMQNFTFRVANQARIVHNYSDTLKINVLDSEISIV